jgi:hypothetical protein
MTFTVSAGYGATVATPYEIAAWQGFRTAAISYTFDDGCSNQFAIAVPMFDARGLKLTLFTVTGESNGLFPGWAKLQDAASRGHEIASHTVNHTTLQSLPDAQMIPELRDSQAAINANIPGQKCLTLAYPNCVGPNSTALLAQYYIAARTCDGSLVPRIPSFMSIPSIAHTSAQDFTNNMNSALASKAWCVFLTHGIDNDRGYSPIPSSALQTSVNYVAANQDKFWVDTFGNVCRYVRERLLTSVTVLSNQVDSLAIQVTNNLDNSIFNYPITLRRPLPASWPSAAVWQNNTNLSARIVTVSSTNYVVFDVVPNAGDVLILESGIVVVAPTQQLGAVQDRSVSMPALKLLAGSSENAGYALSVTAVDSTSINGGLVSWTGDQVTYSPPAGFTGPDAFGYTLGDGHGGSGQGTVVVTVASVDAQTLNLIAICPTPTNCLLDFAGLPGRTYVIQSAPAITGPWTDLSGPITAEATGLIEFVDTNSPSPAQFYRTTIWTGGP